MPRSLFPEDQGRGHPQAEEELKDTESIYGAAEQTVAEDFEENAEPTDNTLFEPSDLPASDETPETIDFSETSEIPEEPVISAEDNALPDDASETEE